MTMPRVQVLLFWELLLTICNYEVEGLDSVTGFIWFGNGTKGTPIIFKLARVVFHSTRVVFKNLD